MRTEFIGHLRSNESAFSIQLDSHALERLADLYELILAHNDLLHLVAPAPPEEMATRHFLESLTMLKHLPTGAKFVDVGSGGGFPALPCLAVREDLSAVLIESKEKKAAFLRECIDKLGLAARASVVAKQFAETSPGDAQFVTCRALDKFTSNVGKLVKWSGKRRVLFFGGENLGELLQAAGRNSVQELMPLSERRYLYAA